MNFLNPMLHVRNSAAFIENENGAVTVDWVVLTAALVGLGLAAMGVVTGGVEDLSNDVDGQLQDDRIIRTNFFVAPTIVAYGLEDLTIVPSNCVDDGNGGETCTEGYEEHGITYWTEDGDAWGRTTRTYDSSPTTVVWKDADGREVETHEIPDVPDDLEFSMFAPN